MQQSIALWVGLLVLLMSQGPILPAQSTMEETNKEPYAQEWANIDSLAQQGLYRSALEATEALYVRTKADGEDAHSVRTLLYRQRFQGELNEDGRWLALRNLEREMETWDGSVKAVLQSILANEYYGVFQQQFWQIQDRTPTGDQPTDDFTTWTGRDLVQKSTELFLASTREMATRTVSITDFELLLTQGQNTEGLRPYLYDLLIHRALAHFQQYDAFLGELDGFPLDDNQALLAPLDEFLALQWEAEEPANAQELLVRLLQEALAWRSTDDNAAALLDLDLVRLQLLHQRLVAEQKDEWLKTAYGHLQQKHRNTPLEAPVRLGQLQLLQQQGQQYQSEQPDSPHRWAFRDALQVAEDIQTRFPESYAAEKAKQIVAEIKAPHLRAYCEQVSLPGQHGLVGLEYQNVERLYFRIVQMSIDDRLTNENNEEKLKRLLKRRSVQAWNETLPDPGDYRKHWTETSFKPLTLGGYALLIADNKDFTTEGGAVLWMDFWVSKIGLLTTEEPSGGLQLLLADRETGAPMAGVSVTLWSPNDNGRRWRSGATYRSDAQGRLLLSEVGREQIRLQLRYGRDEIFSSRAYYNYRNLYPTTKQQQTTFFTDRSIYRPGQVIHFKALLTELDDKRIPSVLPGQKATITLHDANGQEVDRLELTANAFGSVTGTFKAPEGVLLGQMSLRSDVGGNSQYFRVEEYKRPRFAVEMENLAGQPQLGSDVKVSGLAKAYAGPNVQDVAVNYTVTRSIRFPWFWGYRRGGYFPPMNQQPVVIATGTTQTDEYGRFSVTFTAIPDETIPNDRFPLYVYELTADVTDVTGETRTGTKTIRLARYGLQIDLRLPDQHDRNEPLLAQVKSENLDGQALVTEGQLVIERLDSPDRLFIDRYWSRPDQKLMNPRFFRRNFEHLPYDQEDQPDTWAVAQVHYDARLNTGTQDSLTLAVNTWPVGYYRWTFSVVTEAGDTLKSIKTMRLYDWAAGAFPSNDLVWMQPNKTSYQPGEEAVLDLGATTGDSYVLVEVARDNANLIRQWEHAAPTTTFRFPVREADRGGLAVNCISVRWNRLFTQQFQWSVPWTNKELSISYETFRTQLYPDQEEEWILRIDGTQKDRIAAELLASMYDASLDQINPHSWNYAPYPDRAYYHQRWDGDSFRSQNGYPISRDWHTFSRAPQRAYPSLSVMMNQGRNLRTRTLDMENGMVMKAEAAGMMSDAAAPMITAASPPPPSPYMALTDGTAAEDSAESTTAGPPPTKVRTNLSETAFFFPQLTTDAEGRIVLKFRAPESLTQWKLQLFAHDQELAYALDEKEIVTRKELMVLPNAPRFLRAGDELAFTTKVSNLSEQALSGNAWIELFELESGAIINATYGLSGEKEGFQLQPGSSQGFAWLIKVPQDAAGVIGYRVQAQAGQYADGEEAALPVITNQVLLTETLPLFVRSGKSETFRLEPLANAKKGIQHQSLTFELTSNPVWLAIKSLPYLQEYPHECTEQIVNRYFANSIATDLVESFPQIRDVFEQWRQNASSLQSPLLANQDLKSAILEETPWVLDAQDENRQRERIALLFDLDRMATELAVALERLQQRQSMEGGFAWFPGGRDSWYVTQYVVEELAHLKALGIGPANSQISDLLQRALTFCDREALEAYKRLLEDAEAGRRQLKDDQLTSLWIHYLYVRSFFSDAPVDEEVKAMLTYFQQQAEQHWTRKSLYEQAMLALAMHRNGQSQGANAVMASLRERALQSEELGMYWKYPRGYYWHQLPLETHALIMEAFHELGGTADEMDELRLWLLRNKETNRWETTKATAAAVYALLVTSGKGIQEGELIEAQFTKAKKDTYEDRLAEAMATAEAGTGYYQLRWTKEEVQPDLGTVRLRNKNEFPAWGGLYWQYFQQLDQVEVFADTPLKIERTLYRSVSTDQGAALESLSTAPKPGDKLTVRLVIRTDRDMEFIHLKDLRAGALEPIEQLSGYRYLDGLGFYQSTTDLGTHFFFDYLPQGSYVIEYDLWVTYKGQFSQGLATLQCMYAPAFSSHSEGGRMKVE